jgi:hypothetical protein
MSSPSVSFSLDERACFARRATDGAPLARQLLLIPDCIPITFRLSSVFLPIGQIHRVRTRAGSGRCNLTIPLFVDVFGGGWNAVL